MARLTPAIVRIETESGWGSGVVIRSDGYILTALNVVENAAVIQARLSNGPLMTAELEGVDLSRGIAMLSVKAVGLMTVALRADEALAPNDKVIRWGYGVVPGYGLQPSFTSTAAFGRITALHEPKRPVSALLQTDMPITRGDSGGPLITEHGVLIGIMVFNIVADPANGAGYAVPLDVDGGWMGRMLAGETICQPAPQVLSRHNLFRHSRWKWYANLPARFQHLQDDSADFVLVYDPIPPPQIPLGEFKLAVGVFINDPVPKALYGDVKRYLATAAVQRTDSATQVTLLTDPRRLCMDASPAAYEAEVRYLQRRADGAVDYVRRERWLALEAGESIYLLRGFAWKDRFDFHERSIDTVLYSFRFMP